MSEDILAYPKIAKNPFISQTTATGLNKHTAEQVDPLGSEKEKEDKDAIKTIEDNEAYAKSKGYLTGNPPSGTSDANGRHFMGLPLPWSDQDKHSSVYNNRSINAMPLCITYVVILTVISLIVLFRYEKNPNYWTVVLISLLWFPFGWASIWYAYVNGSKETGLFLAFMFVLTYITFIYVTLERNM